MYSTLFCLALLTATAAPAVFATFAINDPTLTQVTALFRFVPLALLTSVSVSEYHIILVKGYAALRPCCRGCERPMR